MMIPIDEIMLTAHKIKLDGKHLSLALLKHQLNNRYPMPLLIQGLQQYKQLTDLDKQALFEQLKAPKAATAAKEKPQETSTGGTQALTQAVEKLSTELTQLQQQHQALLSRVTQLEALLAKACPQTHEQTSK